MKHSIPAADLLPGMKLAANGGTLLGDVAGLVTRWGTVVSADVLPSGWWDVRVEYGDQWPSHLNVPAARLFVADLPDVVGDVPDWMCEPTPAEETGPGRPMRSWYHLPTARWAWTGDARDTNR